MEPAPAEPKKIHPLSWWLILSVGAFFAVLSFWTWQKWDTVWIERSNGFFPPEWQNEDLEDLAWRYPIYRSNDSYQWAHLADAVAEGNQLPLHHRFDEGIPEGRPNRWHSGLAYLLSASGSLVAAIEDWPVERGIHHTAHWLGAAIQLCALLGGTLLIGRLAGRRGALLFAGLFFFHAAIAWDFAFSRLDHEAVFQFFFLFHLIGLAGMLTRSGRPSGRWALLAGISAGFCWWISATVMSALSALTTLGLLAECSRQSNSDPLQRNSAVSILTWGGSASTAILLFCLLDGRLTLESSIATIHPIFILAQFGAALVCLALFLDTKVKRSCVFLVGLLCGLCPLAWLFAYGTEAHPWLDPMMRRLHDYIVEFQSPFGNGLWAQAETWQALAVGLLALVALWLSKETHKLLFAVLTLGLLLLALLQTRWLGMLATVGIVGLCLSLRPEKMPKVGYLGLALLLLSFGTWTHKWLTIEENPGRIFVTDLMLQVGARDINLNLQRLSGGETIQVAMPYAFAATSALFPEVHPLGTFYWENATGIRASSDFFAGQAVDTPIDYAVVQGGRQGAPFAKLANWVAKEDVSPASIESGLAWRFSNQKSPEGWEERPFYGTFPDTQFSVRIFSR